MEVKKRRLQPFGFLISPIYLQIIQPHLIWLLKQRPLTEATQDRIGVNASIILFSAIYLEGFFEDVLCSFIWSTYDRRRNTKSQAVYNIEKLASLDSYIEAFERIGVPLSNFLSGVDSEDLNIIFKLRNLLAHGQRDSYYVMHAGDYKPQTTEGGYYKKLDEFFVKRKIIKYNPHPQGNDFKVIFSDPVADWVYKRMKELCLSILKHMESGIKTQSQLQNFRMETIRNRIVEL